MKIKNKKISITLKLFITKKSVFCGFCCCCETKRREKKEERREKREERRKKG